MFVFLIGVAVALCLLYTWQRGSNFGRLGMWLVLIPAVVVLTDPLWGILPPNQPILGWAAIALCAAVAFLIASLPQYLRRRLQGVFRRVEYLQPAGSLPARRPGAEDRRERIPDAAYRH